ncbi:MAG TPA: hypothetical protein DEG43_01560 [Acidimicrobiaceae bacterium]|nr:hypothetical protein [Acidimicrobiaceae bacterium]
MQRSERRSRSLDTGGVAVESESGFTLVELLVVIVILAVLSAIVVASVNGIKDRGQEAACKQDMRTLKQAEEAFSANARVFRAPNIAEPIAAYASIQTLQAEGFLGEDAAAIASPSRYHTLTTAGAVQAGNPPAAVTIYGPVTKAGITTGVGTSYTITPSAACSAYTVATTIGA